MSAPCFTCGEKFKTTYEAQALNKWIKNPYGQHCEPCAKKILLSEHPGTEEKLRNAIPKQAEIFQKHFSGGD